MRASRARATVRVHGPYGGSGPTLPNGLTRPGRPRAPAHHPIPVHRIDGSGLRDTRRPVMGIRDERGVTLIELMVTAMLLVIALTGLARSYPLAMHAVTRAGGQPARAPL